MMDDLILETRDKETLAPSSLPPVIPVDPELEKEYEKIPDKLAFKIGEVADILGVKPYVLRYWETEFEAISPKKSKSNQRMYERKDVETLLLIKKLLYKDRFSIEGARSALKRIKQTKRGAKEVRNIASHVEDLREKTEEVLEQISRIRALFS